MTKHRSFEKIGFVALAFFFTSRCIPEVWAQPSSGVPISPGRLLVRLPYRAESEKPLQDPYRVALFETGTEFYKSQMLGCDWQGNFYLFDAARQDKTLLKRFDRKGRFQEMWELPRSRRSRILTVTRDGTIWLDVEQVEGASGLPLLTYRSGSKQPIANWRRKLPVAVGDAIQKALAKQGLIRTGLWDLVNLRSGGNQIWMRLSGPVAGVKEIPSYSTMVSNARLSGVWLRMNSAGTRVIDLAVEDPQKRSKKGRLTEQEGIYYTEADLNRETLKWSQWRMWKQGQDKGEPWFTVEEMVAGKKPWQKALGFSKVISPPRNYLDARDNLYLIWGRDSQAGEHRFTVGNKSWTRGPLTWGEGDKALVVLDKNRRCIAFLPWRPSYYELIEHWIHPLPDGSGFYRQEYAEKELRIYFHALPIAKTKAR